MSLAIVLGSLNPGGAETQMVRKAIHLQARGWNVTVVLPNGAGNMPGNRAPWLRKAGVPMRDCASSGEMGRQGCLRRHFEAIQADVMDAVGYPATLKAAMAAQAAGVPHRIIRFESCGYVREEFPAAWNLEYEGHQAATAFVGNSQAVVDSIGQYDGTDGTPRYVIHNGVDLPPMRERPARDRVTIGLLANFRADGLKNQQMAVRAAAWLVARGVTNFVMELVGYETPYQRIVEADVRTLRVGEYVRFPGQIHDLGRLWDWDIAINTSRTEGLSNAIQEGMAYGLPTVATAVGGNPELVDDGVTGYLVPDDDEHALADALEVLITAPALRTEMGQRAREKAERCYSWDAILDRWERLYRHEL